MRKKLALMRSCRNYKKCDKLFHKLTQAAIKEGSDLKFLNCYYGS